MKNTCWLLFLFTLCNECRFQHNFETSVTLKRVGHIWVDDNLARSMGKNFLPRALPMIAWMESAPLNAVAFSSLK
jgi:hypothetical protein